jgi:hypothetical protein
MPRRGPANPWDSSFGDEATEVRPCRVVTSVAIELENSLQYRGKRRSFLVKIKRAVRKNNISLHNHLNFLGVVCLFLGLRRLYWQLMRQQDGLLTNCQEREPVF